MDTRYRGLRDKLADEAAQAYSALNGGQNVDVVLWETMAVASRQSRVAKRLMENPGVFIAAIYNTYGEGEYLSWRDDVMQKADSLQAVDLQG